MVLLTNTQQTSTPTTIISPNKAFLLILYELQRVDPLLAGRPVSWTAAARALEKIYSSLEWDEMLVNRVVESLETNGSVRVTIGGILLTESGLLRAANWEWPADIAPRVDSAIAAAIAAAEAK